MTKILEIWQEAYKDKIVIGDKIKELFEISMDTYKIIFSEMQEVKLNIDKLYYEIVEKKRACDNSEIEEIVNQIHNFHRAFWSGFSLLNIIQGYLPFMCLSEAEDIENKAKRMSYSIEGGLAYVIYYLDGTDLNTLHLEYKKGIDF